VTRESKKHLVKTIRRTGTFELRLKSEGAIDGDTDDDGCDDVKQPQ